MSHIMLLEDGCVGEFEKCLESHQILALSIHNMEGLLGRYDSMLVLVVRPGRSTNYEIKERGAKMRTTSPLSHLF